MNLEQKSRRVALQFAAAIVLIVGYGLGRWAGWW